jgi:hypothetical protein
MFTGVTECQTKLSVKLGTQFVTIDSFGIVFLPIGYKLALSKVVLYIGW